MHCMRNPTSLGFSGFHSVAVWTANGAAGFFDIDWWKAQDLAGICAIADKIDYTIATIVERRGAVVTVKSWRPASSQIY